MITLQDLGLAYRKAKVDLYYSSHASIEAIADYEEKLLENLSSLLAKINGESEDWVQDKAFLGTYTIAAKSIDMSAWKAHQKEHGNGLIFSSAADEWTYACAELAKGDEPKQPTAEFRVMAKCHLDFHVLSTLWMLEVGQFFDAKLSNAAYGNRLRRTEKGDKTVNHFSLGTFKPYLKPFKDWRDQGIQAMRTALDADKKIVALTADVKSFYHELNPSFMLDPAFFKDVVGLVLTDGRLKLHPLFITALQAWAQNTPLKKGLPVGLPASAVVANMALIELDAIVEKELVPLYYGRYVDDILLVMENGSGFRSKEELWAWIFKRFGKQLAWVDGKKKNEIISFQPTYLSEGASQSQIHFANDKNKVFMLSGPTGKTLVEAIEHQIYERASEWRAMPRLPRSSNYVGTDLLAATQSDGEAADNLRKADALTMRRAGFAIKLRDYEAYERDLHPYAWKAHRHAFFEAIIDHVLVLPNFFDLAVYLPRVVRLATACEDFHHVRKIINALNKLCGQVKDGCQIQIKSCLPENQPSDLIVINLWQLQLFDSIRESIAAALPPQMSKAGKLAWNESMADYLPDFDVEAILSWYSTAMAFQAQQAKLFSYDLAHMPFRFIGLPKEMIAQRGIPNRKTVIYFAHAEALQSSKVIKGNQLLAHWINLKNGLPNGLLFATRPFNVSELFMLNKDAYVQTARAEMQAVVFAVRGFELGDKTPTFDKQGVLQIPDGPEPKKYNIAVSSWKTRMDSWTASVMRMRDPDVDRYARLCRLLDIVIAEPQHSRYLILPELALPAQWFMRIARKLQGRGISLITGIEYLHAPKKVVRNQVWAALSHDGLGFPSLMVYRQDKQAPALHEETELQRLAGLEMKAQQHKIWKHGMPPIIQHGEFRFAMLICSELTNIRYRAALRGRVDALFVPEWNQDTETFNALVESAALDMHAYIIQCNDRQYGDSRIRAPFRDSWLRDVLRVKGGVTDYCVIGEIDVQALRRFQSSHRSASKPFKPVPDGFEIDFGRKVLPAGDKE
jgi:hypothetical protein